METQAAMQTLGQLLHQARALQGLSLRQAAARLRRQDGRPITAKYLHLLEHDCRRPSLHLTQQLAAMLALDEAFLVAQAHQTDALLRRYLQGRPEQEIALAEMVLKAEQHGFVAWERVTTHIIARATSPATHRQTRTRRIYRRRPHDADTALPLSQRPDH